MVLFLYNIFISIYVAGIRIASLWNSKAKEWIKGRENLFTTIEKKIDSGYPVVWIHCASAGEFEQGKPVIEMLKTEFPRHQIVVSFFSPSGYNSAKKYPGIIITYLPSDTQKNAHRFINTIHPNLIIFVKYEFWYHHIAAAAYKHIPVILVSAIFRPRQVFFQWYGKFFRQMLFLFRYIFVQDNLSLNLLEKSGIIHSSVAGDTRFDRVIRIADSFEPIPFIEKSLQGNKSIIAGSTWKEDEFALKTVWDTIHKFQWKLIIAPHEIDESHLKELSVIFPGAVYYSGRSEREKTSANEIVIAMFGILSRLYFYADIAYIGGGFNKSGIHNTLEAATFGKPVLFGPNYHKFKEARDLISAGAAFSISNTDELKNKIEELINDPQKLEAAGLAAKNYVRNNAGATKKIINYIQENRLLTS